ncbi:MAG: methionyl-tRNA formyltransferase [Eubacteriaceae bacterium]
MRVIFMGTPDFAVPTLQSLINSDHEIISVYTQPDKPNSRGNKIVFSPIKTLSLEHSIKVMQPNSIKDKKIIEEIRDINPDIIVVVAYGQLLPLEILQIPKFGCINIHASLLPKYRGSAPIHWSIINGENETGVTTMYMDVGMDTGDIINKEKINITENMNVEVLHDKLSFIGAQLLIKTFEDIEKGIAPRIKQNNDLSTYAPLLTKDVGKINWKNNSDQIYNLVRGTNPWPGAFTFFGNKRVKIFTTIKYSGKSYLDIEPGTIIDYHKNKGLLVKTGDDCIYIETLQFPNKKRLHVDDFILGNEIENGTVLK